MRCELVPIGDLDPVVALYKKDVDRTLLRANLARLGDALAPFRPYLRGEIPGGGTYEELLPHAITVTIFGRETRLLGLEWLIHVKRAAGRPKDLEVIAELEALAEETMYPGAENV